MKNNLVKTILLGALLIISLFGVYMYLRKNENNNYEKRGLFLIKKIETYKQIEHKLPNTLKDLGMEEPMNDGPYYEKIDSIYYKIYFNIGFDNSRVYYSKTKSWKDEP
ncbi:hypothetical protein ACT4R0_09770 [Ornithobacterium rhinotracheale]|uniref:hypothetical protein n=1 Tax=Ornithobacterium rhinotracheale TaxID=28251 RepID=UPI0040362F63